MMPLSESENLPDPLSERSWLSCPLHQQAVTLFNEKAYWNAHEAWEELWIAAGRRGPSADFLKALIKLAAAGVKEQAGNPIGVRRHARRAIELLAPISSPRRYGLLVAHLRSLARFAEEHGRLPDAKHLVLGD
ncbi:DUF309 domain-containing protein [Botrimarina hoheduenensis]|uniref:DUF309 domain-containing protein n=1 Tax=Botrimarina hoheduenensis TaxID=2528000 RepID=A0A5C5WE31_9BACT|nr:DUF309 domain-containing protein [Botrimarina hoheduenensis]TWT48860.1 hypothetical protein Pla111_06360 [Botrimarina hoheduenensis]